MKAWGVFDGRHHAATALTHFLLSANGALFLSSCVLRSEVQVCISCWRINRAEIPENGRNLRQ